jgi:hypothetical protein
MSLPTLEKTWQFNVNQAISPSDVSTDRRNLWFKIKQTLTSFPSNPWVVVRSCNSVSVSASDLWLTEANVIQYNDSNPHSWIVLQQPAMSGGNYQLCLSCDGTGGQYGSIAVSPSAGFTGGSTLYRATATDEAAVVSHTYWSNLTSSLTTVSHAMMSTDGTCTRMFTYAGGVCVNYFCIETLADSPLTNKSAIIWPGQNFTNRAVNNLLSLNLWNIRYNGSNLGCYTATESFNGVAVPAQGSGAVHDFSAAYPMTPLSVHSANGGARGRAGRLVDMWMGSIAIPDASNYPVTPPDRELIQLRQFVLPWNGSSPQIV